MEKYLLFVVIVSFLCYRTLAEPEPTDPLDPKCMDYVIPEPPCCGSNILLGPRLRGGELINKTAGEFPWWVTVLHGPGSCLGSLLSTEWVVTAVHCVGRAGRVRVRINNYKGDMLADKVLKKSDIALLHLVRPFQYSFYNRPLCLPIAPELKARDWSNSNVISVGWDRGKSIRSRRDLVAKQKQPHKILTRKHTNGGDSGGAMVMQLDNNPRKMKAYYALAIHSGGAGKYAIAFSVPYYIDWIKDSIQPACSVKYF